MEKADLGKHCLLLHKPDFPRRHNIHESRFMYASTNSDKEFTLKSTHHRLEVQNLNYHMLEKNFNPSVKKFSL